MIEKLSVRKAWFLLSQCCLMALLADYLLIRLHGVVWEYETIFNAKYFIINGKITSLCSRNRSAVLTYIYNNIHIHTSSCLLVTEDDRHTQLPTLDFACTNTHSWACLFLVLLGVLHYLHTLVAVYWRFGWSWQAKHTHPK